MLVIPTIILKTFMPKFPHSRNSNYNVFQLQAFGHFTFGNEIHKPMISDEVSRLSEKCTNVEVSVSLRNFNQVSVSFRNLKQVSVSEGYGLDYITDNNLV